MEEKKSGAKLLSLLFTAIYFASYVTRINFAAIVQELVSETGFEKSLLSIVLVCLSVTYGVGQIINGRIGDKIKPQNLILIGLCVATAVNLLFPLAAASVPFMCVLWAINGFAQAMMWPPMVKIMVSTMTEAEYGAAVVQVSAGSSIGTIAVYLSAPLIISLIGWQAVFYVSAIVGFLITALWFFMKDRVSKAPEKEIREDTEEKAAPTEEKEEKPAFPKAAIFPIVFIALAIIFQGMLRDGVSSWMPSYLAEVFGMENEASILLTVSLSVFSVIAFYLSGFIYKKCFKNEVTCGAVIFGVATIAAALMFLSLFFDLGPILSVIFMMLITGCMHGVNLMLITHVPKRFKKYGNISTISGAINSCTYIGSAIFTYGVAVLAETLGWHVTVGIWAIIALLGTLSATVAIKRWRSFID